MPLPIPRPISGKRFAPKIRMMMARIMMSSGIPMGPSRANMAQPFSFVRRANSTTTLLRASRSAAKGVRPGSDPFWQFWPVEPAARCGNFGHDADNAPLPRGSGCKRPPKGSDPGLTPFGVLAGVFLLAAVLAASLAAAPQFTSGVNVVEVYAAATDAQGNPVTGLRREDFTVLEDGRPQPVSAFAEGDFPLSVAVALDRSFSMGAKQLPVAVSAARTLLG